MKRLTINVERYVGNHGVDEYLVRLVQESFGGELDGEQRELVEKAMVRIMRRYFGDSHWNSTISAKGEVVRFKMNWSGGPGQTWIGLAGPSPGLAISIGQQEDLMIRA